MKNTHLDIWAKQIIKQTGFKTEKEIKRASYYSSDRIRVLIFTGKYKNKPALLKIYDDPRINEEPLAQIKFNQQNKSKILRAAQVYDYQISSPQKGWLIMERLPTDKPYLTRPLKPKQRKEFLKIYLEYHKNFPVKANRTLHLVEYLSAPKFHLFRIARWLQLANDKEAEYLMNKQKPVLNPKEFIPRYEKGIILIEKEFKKIKMIWSHGLFNPSKILKHEDQYYLIDFGHNKMYPRGYELSFIIWADWFISTDWKMSYVQWKRGIDEWIKEIELIAKKLKIKNFNSLIKASLVERCLGTILADICATDQPRKEKQTRIKLIYKLIDELIK